MVLVLLPVRLPSSCRHPTLLVAKLMVYYCFSPPHCPQPAVGAKRKDSPVRSCRPRSSRRVRTFPVVERIEDLCVHPGGVPISGHSAPLACSYASPCLHFWWPCPFLWLVGDSGLHLSSPYLGLQLRWDQNTQNWFPPSPLGISQLTSRLFSSCYSEGFWSWSSPSISFAPLLSKKRMSLTRLRLRNVGPSPLGIRSADAVDHVRPNARYQVAVS